VLRVQLFQPLGGYRVLKSCEKQPLQRKYKLWAWTMGLPRSAFDALFTVAWWDNEAVATDYILFRMSRSHATDIFLDKIGLSSESEAAGVHCALWNNFLVQPGESFMVCDAGGGTIVGYTSRLVSPWNTINKVSQDTAVFRMGAEAQISNRSCYFGGGCGSQFLDVQFRLYLEQWHQARNIRLNGSNLAHYMHTFTNTVKILFTGENDAEEFLFDCYDMSDYRKSDHDQGDRSFSLLIDQLTALIDIPGDGLLNGQLVVTTGVLRERVFDPIINRVCFMNEAHCAWVH
jgi:hypothetical protein